MGSPYALANAAEARWKKTLGLRDNPFHDLTCRWDIMDQRASFTSYHSGDIEVATLARCNIIARHLVRCGVQFVLMPQPLLGVTIAQKSPSVRVLPPVATRQVTDTAPEYR